MRIMMMLMAVMTMVMVVVMMMVMTNKLSAVYLISYSASKIPRVLPLLSYYTFGREGGMIKNIIFFTKHSDEIFRKLNLWVISVFEIKHFIGRADKEYYIFQKTLQCELAFLVFRLWVQ